MNFRYLKLTTAALAALFAAAIAMPASAQQAVMKECGDQWQKAKAAKKTGGKTWPKFLAECRAKQAKGTKPKKDTASKKAKKAKSSSKKASAKKDKMEKKAKSKAKSKSAAKPKAKSSKKAKSNSAKPTGRMSFPRKVNSKYKYLPAGQQRMKTCADKYNANKAKGSGNGGLKWIVKGGGYWSECNKSLKS